MWTCITLEPLSVRLRSLTTYLLKDRTCHHVLSFFHKRETERQKNRGTERQREMERQKEKEREREGETQRERLKDREREGGRQREM